MKIFAFFSFILSLAKAGLWIGVGLLVKNHFETVLNLIIRKPVPESLIEKEKLEMVNTIIKWVGIFIIVIGIGMALSAFTTLFL